MNITDEEILELSRLYGVWKSMKDRCSNPKSSGYEWYGARGISVCKEWENFPSFARWSMSNGSSKGLQLDRIDNDSGYGPSNCRYVTASVNMSNRGPISSPNRTLYEAFGEKKTLTDWSKDARCAVKYTTLRSRVSFRKWDIEEALLTITSRKPKTHCSQGHELTEDNVYRRSDNTRMCATCAKERERIRYHAKKLLSL